MSRIASSARGSCRDETVDVVPAPLVEACARQDVLGHCRS